MVSKMMKFRIVKILKQSGISTYRVDKKFFLFPFYIKLKTKNEHNECIFSSCELAADFIRKYSNNSNKILVDFLTKCEV